MTRRRRHIGPLVAVSLFVAALVPSACSDGGVVGGECRSGFIACNGACVDPASDPENCGSCGHACPTSVSCVAQVCGGDGSAGDGGYLDGEVDGDADISDAHGDRDGPDDAGDGNPGDGNPGDGNPGDGGCFPPFDTPAQCGDCNTSCSAAAPLCSPVDGGFACVPACDPPLVACGGQCVDLQTDPDHCGACFNKCPSGICEMGKCVGGTSGHVVVLCSSYEQSFKTSPQTTLLGNSVFLLPQDPVRILAYTEHSPTSIENKVDQAITWSAQAKGRTFQLTLANSVNAVTTGLIKQDYEVFLVYDQTAAPSGALGTAGTAFAPGIDTFVKAGGVVVVTSGGGGTGEMGALLTNAGLLNTTAQPSATGTVVYNHAPLDAVGVNVISPYLTLTQTCTLSTPTPPGPNLVFVVTDAPLDGGVGKPLVIHRTP